MWRVEKDPFLASTFGTVTILDRPPDFDRLRARMETAVHAVPRLGWRVQPNPTALGAPIWADDPDFDIDLHVRRVALPAPGTLRQLLRPRQPVRARPARPHPPALAVPRRRGAGGRQGGAGDEDAPHDHRRGQRCAHVDAVRRPDPTCRRARRRHGRLPTNRRRPRHRTRSTRCSASSMPRSACRSASPARSASCSPTRRRSRPPDRRPSDGLRGALTQLSDSDAARSPLWTERSMRRRLEVARAPLQSTRAAAKRLGGSLNTPSSPPRRGRPPLPRDQGRAGRRAARHDGREHADQGLRRQRLRARQAARADRRDGHHRALPAHRRVAAIRRPSESGAGRRRWTPSPPSPRHCRRRCSPASPGSRRRPSTSPPPTCARHRCPYFIAGGKALQTYAIGPLGGVAFNVTMLSYVKHLDLGINVDTAAVDGPGAARQTRRRGVPPPPASPLSECRERQRLRGRVVAGSGRRPRRGTPPPGVRGR